MEKTIEIPEGYEARIEGNKVILEQKESEDERIRKSIVETIKQCPDTFLNPKNRDRMLAYLERQKESELLNNDEYHTVKVKILDRLYAHEKELEQLKKKQKSTEWSDIDELKLQTIEAVIARQKGSAAFGGFLPEELIDYLKSLRPQPHWKPSEEQMEALECAIGIMRYMRDGDFLQELYADLKKL